ncbi:DUF6799 domain-containing protein [Spongiivirga citrea]|uniref:DUF6799 domain-containing protein n=1 Tax=Spongiivirga citrea TaxID=1481457 RepID=A0A6M0CG21_9FLAO|nr:DUF6799 domain-containing protein [Spongiivirga citrea]NER16808.1 hypothetical protein [Spongiivirga citrea]
MKKVCVLVVMSLVVMTTAFAQDQDQVRDRDRLMLVDGDVLQIRDRDQIRLKDKATLADGTILSADGYIQIRDRDRLRLNDGECIDPEGVRYRNEYHYRFKMHKNNQGLTQAQIQARSQNRFHYVYIDGEVIKVLNQSQNKIEKQVRLGDGTTVNPDGSYVRARDQDQARLRDGE